MVVVKISRDGCLRIPEKYIKLLGSDLLEVGIEGGRLVLKPVERLGATFKRFAFTDRPLGDILKAEREAAVNGFVRREKDRID